ncbi:MAG: hypothetical protein R3A13_12650, partial [Bdellovibrionota bacterium]
MAGLTAYQEHSIQKFEDLICHLAGIKRLDIVKAIVYSVSEEQLSPEAKKDMKWAAYFEKHCTDYLMEQIGELPVLARDYAFAKEKYEEQFFTEDANPYAVKVARQVLDKFDTRRGDIIVIDSSYVPVRNKEYSIGRYGSPEIYFALSLVGTPKDTVKDSKEAMACWHIVEKLSRILEKARLAKETANLDFNGLENFLKAEFVSEGLAEEKPRDNRYTDYSQIGFGFTAEIAEKIGLSSDLLESVTKLLEVVKDDGLILPEDIDILRSRAGWIAEGTSDFHKAYLDNYVTRKLDLLTAIPIIRKGDNSRVENPQPLQPFMYSGKSLHAAFTVLTAKGKELDPDDIGPEELEALNRILVPALSMVTNEARAAIKGQVIPYSQFRDMIIRSASENIILPRNLGWLSEGTSTSKTIDWFVRQILVQANAKIHLGVTGALISDGSQDAETLVNSKLTPLKELKEKYLKDLGLKATDLRHNVSPEKELLFVIENILQANSLHHAAIAAQTISLIRQNKTVSWLAASNNLDPAKIDFQIWPLPPEMVSIAGRIRFSEPPKNLMEAVNQMREKLDSNQLS